MTILALNLEVFQPSASIDELYGAGAVITHLRALYQDMSISSENIPVSINEKPLIPNKATSTLTLARKHCPQCADVGYFDLSFDYAFIKVCHLHGTVLADRCWKCHQPLTWTNGSHQHCGCSENLNAQAVPTVSDYSGAKSFFELLRTQDIERISLVKTALAYVARFIPEEAYANEHLNFAMLLLSKSAADLHRWLAHLQILYPCLPSRLMLMAWARKAPAIQRGVIRSVIRKLPRKLSTCRGHCKTAPGFKLNELSLATGLGSFHLAQLVREGALQRDSEDQLLNASAICSFYQSLDQNGFDSGRNAQRLFSASRLEVAKILASLPSGRVGVHGFSPNRSFRHLKYHRKQTSSLQVPRASSRMGIQFAAKSLLTSVPYLQRMMALPSIRATSQIDKDGHHWIEISAVEDIRATIVLLPWLSRRLKVSEHALVRSIAENQITPVHSPQLDASSDTAFPRAQLEAKMASVIKSLIAFGEKPVLSPGDVLPPIPPPGFVDFWTCRELIDEPPSSFPALLNAELLLTSKSSASGKSSVLERNWYSMQSILVCKNWLRDSLPINLAAEEAKCAPLTFIKYYVKTGRIKSIQLGRSTRVSKTALRALLSKPVPSQSSGNVTP